MEDRDSGGATSESGWEAQCPKLEGRHFSEKTVKLIQRTYNQFQFDPKLRQKVQPIMRNRSSSHQPPSLSHSQAKATFDPVSSLYIAPHNLSQSRDPYAVRPSSVEVRQSRSFDPLATDAHMKLSDLDLSAEIQTGKEDRSTNQLAHEDLASRGSESSLDEVEQREEEDEEREEEEEQLGKTWKEVAEKLRLNPRDLKLSDTACDDLSSIEALVESHHKQLQEYFGDSV